MRHQPNSARRRRSRTQARSPVHREATMTPTTQRSNGSTNATTSPLDRAKGLASTLLSERGEATGALLARDLHGGLGTLDAGARHGFQRFLATAFRPDTAAAHPAAGRYLARTTAERP